MTEKKRKSGTTAAELVVKLAEDSAYQARKAESDRELEARVEIWRKEELPLLEELRRAGVVVDSVWNLPNMSDAYPVAFPILLKFLETGSLADRAAEAAGRAMAVSGAVEHWERLLGIYRTAEKDGQREGVAVALAACVDKNRIADLIDVVKNSESHETHIYFLRSIWKMGGNAGRRLIKSLADDPILQTEANAILRNTP